MKPVGAYADVPKAWYIELNPVRAEMVNHAGEYKWSYGANAQGREDALLSPHPLYTALGTTPDERQHAYR